MGKHSGTVSGNKYFECPKKCGILVKPAIVTVVDAVDSNATTPAGGDDNTYGPAGGNDNTYGPAGGDDNAYGPAGGANDLVEVTLVKPLGISITGSAAEGVSVTKVKEGSSAQLSGVVKVGMYLHSMNGESVVGAGKEDVVAKIKAPGNEIKLVLGPKPEIPGSEEDVLVEVTLAKPLGISISGDAANGIIVTKVKEGSSAAASGLVKPGMRLMTMGGESVVGKEKGFIVSKIKAVSDSIVIEFAPPKDRPSSSGSVPATMSSLEVVLSKPLGMSIGGDASNGILVTKIKPGSSAAASGEILPGMTLLAMNGTSLIGLGKGEVVALIKSFGNQVTVTFSTTISSLPPPPMASQHEPLPPTPTVNDGEAIYDNGEEPSDAAPDAGGVGMYSDTGKLVSGAFD